jgi:DNA gyrase subunit A
VAAVAGIDKVRASWTLTVTENGYGKRSNLSAYRTQSRNGKGLIDIKTNERNGAVTALETVGPGDHLVIMSEAGQIMRTPVEDLSIVGRNTMGVTVMELAEGDSVASVDVVSAAQMEEDEDGDAETDDEAEEVEATDAA